MPEISDRIQIIAQNHILAIGGYKSVTKTYKRIRHNYFSDMKLEIQRYIQECQNWQLKKVTRRKTRYIVLTHTSGTAFDKISMNIVGPLPITESGLIYTHNTRPTYEILSGSATQAGNVSGNSRSTRGKVYQVIYRAESIDYGSGTEFCKQSDGHISIKYLHTKGVPTSIK